MNKLTVLTGLFVFIVTLLPLNGLIVAQDAGETAISRFAGRGSIHSLVWSPDETVLAASSMHGVWLYDAALADVAYFEPPTAISAAGALAWPPDGTLLAAGNGIDRLRNLAVAEAATVWDMQTGDLVMELPITEEQMLQGLAWSPDGTALAGYLWDQKQNVSSVIVWDVATVTRTFTYTMSSERPLKGIAWADDGAAVLLTAWGEADQAVQITLDATGTVLDQVTAPEPLFTSPDGSLHVSIDRKDIVVTNAATGAVQHTFTLQVEQGFARWTELFWSADGQTLMGYADRIAPRIVAWDITSGDERWRVEMLRDSSPIDVVLSPSTGTLAVATMPGVLDLWDVQSGDHLATRWVDMGGIVSLDLSPDGTQLVTTNSIEPLVRVWNAQTGAGLRVLSCREDYIYSVAWSPDSAMIAGGATQHDQEGPTRIFLWDTASGLLVRTLEIEDGTSGDSIIPLRWSPDGTMLAAARQSNATARVALMVWDTATWDVVYRGEFGGIAPFDWSPDGAWLVIADSDLETYQQRMTLIHLVTGDTATFPHSLDWIFDIAWRPDPNEADPLMWTIIVHDADDNLALLMLPVGETAPDVWLGSGEVLTDET
ncbi:MAG: WD40 repeat domain-containing protein [Anaerolineae bacterium]|nr:WD40 repeat domain-containing protein [Anaerolineae bacterium]